MPATTTRPRKTDSRSSNAPILWAWITHEPREALACGFCVTIAIGTDDDADVSDLDHYALECVRSADGERVVAWRIEKLRQDGDVAAYVLPGNLSRCQCDHSRYRPHGRPCRHRRALWEALSEIGFQLPPLQ